MHWARESRTQPRLAKTTVAFGLKVSTSLSCYSRNTPSSQRVLHCSFEGMVSCIIISSDSDDDIKSDSSVLVFMPTKRPPSPEVVTEDRYVNFCSIIVGSG